MKEELSKVETVTLEHCEDVIEKNIDQGNALFREAGRELLRIHEERLYKGQYKTFEEYCKTRWNYSRSYANGLIDATIVIRNLSAMADKTNEPNTLGTTVPKPETQPKALPMPSSERQARPLTKLKTAEAQREAWSEAVQTAPEGKVTAKHVEEVVKRKTQKKEPEVNPGTLLAGAIPKEEMKAVDCLVMDLQSTYRYLVSALEKTSFSEASKKRILVEVDAIAKKVKG
jgi:hypothetical protein